MTNPTSTANAPIRLVLLPDAPNSDGEPRAALLLPPPATALVRRPALQCFPTLAAALREKARQEGANASP